MSPATVPRSPAQGQRLLQRQLESLRQRLHLLVMRSQDEVAKAAGRLRSEPEYVSTSILDLNKLHSRLKELQGELDRMQSAISRELEVPAGIIPGLNEKLLRHGSELGTLVTTLTDEKHELYRKCERYLDEIQEFQRKSQDTQVRSSLYCKKFSSKPTFTLTIF